LISIYPLHFHFYTIILAYHLTNQMSNGRSSIKTKLSPGNVFTANSTTDSDRDGLTDEQEKKLGTNPNDRDTDHDGLTDGYEFSYDFAVSVGTLPAGLESKYMNEPVRVDQDKDNIPAALDNDDNGDGIHDGDEDADGDGVSNELEFYGYKYDALKGEFVGCLNEQGELVMCPGNQGYYFTDPTQFSTDQDPYGDGMEVSNKNMDVSVKSPANHPLIPAYADIYVSMNNYTVTSIEEITTSQGKQTQSSWTNSTTDEKDDEFNWNVQAGAQISTEIGILSAKVSTTFSLSAGCGGSYGSKHSVTNDTSGLTAEDWDTATTTSTSQAANLTLDLIFVNKGTAAANSIIPTFNLKLGDELIKSYNVPDEKKINKLAPGGKSIELAFGDQDKDKITATMDQLQKIQMGVPLHIDIPQMDAKVAQQDGKGGWTSTQEWYDYKPSIEAVCAHLTIDRRENGKPAVDYLVYATSNDKSNNGPRVKLKDMLGWVLGDDFQIDPGGGFTIYGESSDYWGVGFSDNALENVSTQLKDPEGANGDLMEVIVYQGSPQWEIVFSRILETDSPTIHWSYYNPTDNSVSAYVTDFFGIQSVEFIVSESEKYPMNEENGTGFYTYNLPSSYTFQGGEKIKATNVRNEETEEPVERVENVPVWGMFRHDLQHTGRSQYLGAQKSVQRWRFFTEDTVTSSPAIGADGTIYVGSDDHNLYAIKTNGEKKWAYKTGKDIQSSPAIGPDGTIYVGSKDGNLYAIDPKDGTEKWAFPTGIPVDSSPAIGPDGTIYVGSGNGNLYAIQPNGEQMWAYRTEGYVVSSPAIGPDGTIYVGSGDCNLYAIQPNGEKKWAYRTGSYVESSPAIDADGTIYVGSLDNWLYAIKPNGEKKWAYKTGKDIQSSPAIGPDGTIYVGS
jgi:outer membrane protein assembly factor BamB